MWRTVISRLFIINFIIGFFILASCEKDPATQPVVEKQTITIFYTNDEHGWMEPLNDLAGGASGMLGHWKSTEGYDDSEAFLVLSGGDMWTGPAISTWFEGESMIEVMNTMGYDAAALGNHEFDFSVSALADNASRMNFPVLSANILEKGSGNIPSFVKPYELVNSGEINIGIIGLSSLSTPYSTFPDFVEPYEFIPYEEAINKYAPTLQNLGADIIIVIGHICEEEMIDLIPVAKKYGISVIGGGHCHQIVSRQIDGIAMMQAAAYMAAYAKVELDYFLETKKVNVIRNEFIVNERGYSDQSVESIIEDWRSISDSELTLKIGYCAETLKQKSVEMGNMVVDSWFYTFPDADVTITNSGGIRQDIQQGDITVETIVGLLPFENTLYELDLTGAELLDCSRNYLIGGMTTINGNYLSDGTPIHNDSIYQVLTTDYLYSITSNRMSEYDPDPEYTSVNFRQPLIDWLKSINTSTEDPLENYLDYIARK
jgi:2',3'-cyclic-nucleotide 2'-phosphodiesterase (5'-nucleotidase family)